MCVQVWKSHVLQLIRAQGIGVCMRAYFYVCMCSHTDVSDHLCVYMCGYCCVHVSAGIVPSLRVVPEASQGVCVCVCVCVGVCVCVCVGVCW
jgi:hypothetical protein